MSFNGEAIIQKLEHECRIRGNKYLLKVNYNNENNIMISCPFHSNGQERRPSCGIRKDQNVGHCFTCGWKGGIESVISKTLDFTDSETKQWLNNNFGITDLWSRQKQEEKSDEFVPLKRKKSNISFEYPGFTDEELSSYSYFHPYMYERGLNDFVINSCDIGYDSNSDSITFPVYTLNGKPAFIARRSVKTKFFNYPSGVKKPLYLGEKVQQGCEELWVCESCLDALIVVKNKIPAVALMGLGSKNQISDLVSLRCKNYVLALDNDSSGKKAMDNLYNNLKNIGVVQKVILPEGYKDINDCKDCFLQIRKSFY